MRKSAIGAIIGGLIFALVCAGVLVAVNNTEVKDFVAGFSYEPTAEVATLRSNLQLTDGALRIFNASKPELNEKDEFNAHCNSHNEKISVLGCYTGGKIYAYKITAAELSGVEESTMAHELLHAVWRRLSSEEQGHLSKLLQQVYQENQGILEGELDVYGADEQIDELHSRAGTQIRKLPEELEEHYKKYFRERGTVVAFYEHYSTPFKESTAKVNQLKSELAETETKINDLTEKYKAEAEALEKEIAEFNDCAKTTNCFTSNAAFQARRGELVAKQEELGRKYSEIDGLVASYNAKVAEYNQNVFRTQTLQNEINSNKKVETI